MEYEPLEDEHQSDQPSVPFFEDATKKDHGVKGHTTGKSLEKLKSEVRSAIARLGGGVHRIQHVKFPDPEKGEARYGFVVTFDYLGHPAEMKIAGLPLKNPTDTKKDQSMKQALYTIRESLEAQHNQYLLSPGSHPLLPYVLDADNDRTFGEAFDQQRQFALES